MPNWCVGSLKVRGKQENLINFIKNGLLPLGTKLKEDDTCNLNLYCKGTCHIKNTYRGFVDNLDVYFYDSDKNPFTIVLNTRFAWGIDAEQLLTICKEYNVDMNIYAYERGMEFNQYIEIVNGEIVRDDEIKFNDYMWECPNPELGG